MVLATSTASPVVCMCPGIMQKSGFIPQCMLCVNVFYNMCAKNRQGKVRNWSVCLWVMSVSWYCVNHSQLMAYIHISESESICWHGQKAGLHVRCSAGRLSTEGSTVTGQSPHVYDLWKRARMKLPDTISMEPFQQYLTEPFPKDSKHSTTSPLCLHKSSSYALVNCCHFREAFVQYEKANLPALPHHWRKQWNTWVALLNDRFDRKALQPL